MTIFAALRPRTYTYLTYGKQWEKGKWHKKRDKLIN